MMMSWSATEGILGRGLPLSAQALFEPERIPLKLHDMTAVGETVQERRGEPGITKDLGPAGEVQIRGHQQRAPFIAVGKETE